VLNNYTMMQLNKKVYSKEEEKKQVRLAHTHYACPFVASMTTFASA